MKQAYCSECGGYVPLDEADMCPASHPRPCYRDVREIATQAPPARLAPTQPAMPDSERAPDARKYARSAGFLVIAAGFAAVFALLVSFNLLQCSSAGLGVLAMILVMFRIAGTPYAIVDSRGLTLWTSLKPTVVDWIDIVRCRRAGSIVRLDTRSGPPVDILARNVRASSRAEFTDEFARHLGVLWVDEGVDDPGLVQELRAIERHRFGRSLSLLVISLCAAAALWWFVVRTLPH